MQKVAQMAVVVVMLVMTFHFHTAASAAVSWRPQGRFGKRGSTAADVSIPSTEIEFPVESLSAGVKSFQLEAKLCTLTGVKGVPFCSWSPEGY